PAVRSDDVASSPRRLAGELDFDRVALIADMKEAIWDEVIGVETARHRPRALPDALRSAPPQVEPHLVHRPPMGKRAELGCVRVDANARELDAQVGEPEPGGIADQEGAAFEQAQLFKAPQRCCGLILGLAEKARQLIQRDRMLLGDQPNRLTLEPVELRAT